ncbi:transposase [Bradyrhizobium brasilense]|uniref:Transposase n=1 Tax=Bradyrhizobium brasilense TaxID=1419277 RepID=A0ABY8JSZ2_9BRAD|nr:transposase [Bradyrhizobium brasilense]
MTRFLEDGRLELDTNPIENAIRPVCPTRKMRSSPVMRSGQKIGPCLRRSSPPAINESTRPPTSPKLSRRSSTAIPIAKSKSSCCGDSAKGQASLNRAPAERLPSSLVCRLKDSVGQSFRACDTSPICHRSELC